MLDISDVGGADSSYGLFSSNRDLRQPAYAVGMGGQIVPRRLIFTKGKYYVEIAADPEGDHTAALKLFAAAPDKSLPGDASPPAALGWFPKEKQQSLRLVPESVLGMRILKRGCMAQYEYGKALAQVRHERGWKSAKYFRISSGDGRIYTTFAVTFQAVGKGQSELLKQRFLLGRGLGDAAQPDLTPVGGGEDNVSTLQCG